MNSFSVRKIRVFLAFLLFAALMVNVTSVQVLAASTLSVSQTVESNLVTIQVSDSANSTDTVSVLVIKKDTSSIVYMDQAVLVNGEYTFKTVLPKGEYSGYVGSSKSDKVAIEEIIIENEEKIVGYKAIAPITVTKGETLVLPNAIIAIFDSGAYREAGVQWTSIPSTNTPGTFTAIGQINGSTVTVELVVNVKAIPITPTPAPEEPEPETPTPTPTPTIKITPTPTPTPTISPIAGSKINVEPVLDSATATAKAEVTDAGINAALANAPTDNKGVKSVEIVVPEAEGAKAYEIVLPTAALTQTSRTQVIEVNTPVAQFEIPGNMVPASQAAGSETITLIVEVVDKATINDPAVREVIGNRPVVELNLKVNGKVVSWENQQAPVKVSIPYTPTQEELQNPEHIVVWYIDGQGNAVKVPNGKYDPATGMVTFTTTHFSQYAVSYVVKTFADVSQYRWAQKEIEVLASKGIINGTSQTTFSPAENITRADFLVLLVRTLGLTADFSDNFSDVYKTDYYYDAIGVAKALGITTGVGNNKFNPKEPISRQDMMVLCDRALKIAGVLETKGSAADIQKFSDKGSVAAYAVESVAAIVKEGIVQGNGDGTLNPLGHATRAETAVIMYRIYNKL